MRLVVLLATLSPGFASADDVGITPARLIELADGGYALEADVPPRMVAALREPVVPERFTLAERPSYRRVGVTLVVRYEFGGSDQALEAGDVLLLPWARSAVLLAARWADGTVQRAMFPRSAAGIRVPIEVLRPIQRSPTEVARSRLADEVTRIAPMLLRMLLVLTIALAARGALAIRSALALVAGHVLAMVALDLGVSAIPGALGSSGIAVGVVVIARSIVREDRVRLWPLLPAVGLVDGLGIAGRLVSEGLAPGDLIPAFFGAVTGVDAAILGAAAVLAALVGRERGVAARWAAVGSGSVGVAALIALTVSGLQTAERLIIDPADRMAAQRFELGAGGAPGGAGGGARAAAAPRRLEDPAMVFLTVEPAEVRVEVLLGLRDFLEPLRIAGGPESVVPIEYQGEIEERARRMVGQTIGVAIDGRGAVPILERTDFVSVAATGVTTRKEPRPEPLATSILGVTLVYGVERPPSEITLGWRVFPTPETEVPAVWTDPTGSERIVLGVDRPDLLWANDLSSYDTPPVSAVEINPPRWPLVSMALTAIAGFVIIGPLRRTRWRSIGFVVLGAAVVAYPFARHAVAVPGVAGWTPAKGEAAEVAEGLLTNIYRSFDLRDEEAIYDRLEVSVVGDRLTEIYLENRRALEMENLGGARASVDEVEIQEIRSVRRDGEGGFRIEAVWTVSGSVNHFGHVHYRQNRYDAALYILASDGVWKLREVEILDERRVL